MDQPKKPCLLLLVISLLLLSIFQSGVLAVHDDLADGNKEIGANETLTPETGRSNVTIRNGGDCGHGHGNGGGSSYGAPWTPVPPTPPAPVALVISRAAAADRRRGGYCAAGTCVLPFGTTVSWLLRL